MINFNEHKKQELHVVACSLIFMWRTRIGTFLAGKSKGCDVYAR